MFRIALRAVAVSVCAAALYAQDAPLWRPMVMPPAPLLKGKLLRPVDKPAVCSIPLLEARVTKNVDRMPTLLSPKQEDGVDAMDPIDNMPYVKLPAPPCQEEKR